MAGPPPGKGDGASGSGASGSGGDVGEEQDGGAMQVRPLRDTTPYHHNTHFVNLHIVQTL